MTKSRLICYVLLLALFVIWMADSAWNRSSSGRAKGDPSIEPYSPRPLVGYVVRNGNGLYGIRGFQLRNSRQMTEIYWKNTTISHPISIYSLTAILLLFSAIIFISIHERFTEI